MAGMDVAPARGLAYVGVGLEGRDSGLGVAGRERALVLADDVGLVDVGVRLQHGRRFAWRPVRGQVLK